MILVLAFVSSPFLQYHSSSIAYAAVSKRQSDSGPTIKDPNLTAKIVFRGGLKFPTSMAFLGPDDILVLEKNEGTVKRIVNGVMLQEPLLDVNVANKAERGMLGIAVAKKQQQRNNNNNNTTTYVFLYYTEAAGKKDGTDVTKSKEPLGNRLYRYELVNNSKLVNPKLLLDLPATPGPMHNAGKIIIGLDDNDLYLVIGDVTIGKSQIKNSPDGPAADGRGGILRITQNGKAIKKGDDANILGKKSPLNLYYAYGIRNSFGIDFDPVTKKLWDSENGPASDDEINLVNPGFNSGWSKIQGIWQPSSSSSQQQEQENDFSSSGRNTIPSSSSSSSPLPIQQPNDLVSFGKKGKYSDPEFVWTQPVGVTAIKFLNSSKLGKQYKNDMFVGDFHQGNLYDFNLNKKRTELSLKGSLKDKIANNNSDELNKVIFGKGFGGITDIQVGPDGYLYVLSLYQGGDNCKYLKKDNNNNNQKKAKDCIPYSSSIEGTIFRIAPVTAY
jgi:glucose/arabinose dehydrogenase